MVGLSLKFKINATEVMVGLSPQAKFGKTLIVGEGKKFKVNCAQEQQSYFALR